MIRTRRVFRLVSVLALAAAPIVSASEVVLHVSWMLDGTGSPGRGDTYITMQGTRIAAVSSERPQGRSAPVRDLVGDTAIPGLIDAHGHIVFFGLDPDRQAPLPAPPGRETWVLCNARVALASGITTLRDPGTYDWVLPLRREIEKIGLRWMTAGRQMVKRAPAASRDEMFIEFGGVDEARATVRRLRSRGSDFIKLRLTKQRPLPSLDEVRAVVDEAHRFGLKVAAHTDVPHEEAVRLAVAGGVDSLEHNAVLRIPKGESVFADIVRRDIVLVPGMANWEARMDTLTAPPQDIIEEPLRDKLPASLRELITRHASEVRADVQKMIQGGFDPGLRKRQALGETLRAYEAGVRLATGPDTGGSLLPHGRLYKDAWWLAEAGLPIEQVVRAATLNGAHAAGIDRTTGSIEKGKLAEIVVVKGNLAEDYRRLKDVVLVLRGGRVVFDASKPFASGCP
jgi:imidazolonepropionase-like amidohydrolase